MLQDAQCNSVISIIYLLDTIESGLVFFFWNKFDFRGINLRRHFMIRNKCGS